MSTYALLVGVNDYLNPRINPLQGCENDIDLVADTLKQRFGVPSDNIIKLKSGAKGSEARRQNIIDCFHEHLIDKAQQGDVAIFYFSGHGAQAKTHPDYLDIEPDGLDETLVCYDSRQNDIPDLRDKDLRYLIAELGKCCDHISVFLDCCHSAHGTRVIEHEQVQERAAPIDTQSYFNMPYLHEKAASRSIAANGASRTELPASGKHLLMSGCRDYQLSEETVLGTENRRHGRFTHALCEVLNTIQYPISYHELRSRIHTSIHRKQKDQSPQLEAIGGADKRSAVFGGELLPLNLMVHYHDVDASWKLNAGAIHGYSKGDAVSLFKGPLVDSASTVLSGVIQTANANNSLISVTNGSLEIDQQYIAVVSRQYLSKLGICMVSKDPQLETDLEVALQQEESFQDFGRYLKIDTEQPYYEIHLDDRGFYAVQPSVNPKPVFKAQSDFRGVLTQIVVMARWWEKLALQNLETKLPKDVVDLVLTCEGKEYHSEDVQLSYKRSENGRWIKPEFTLELILDSDYPISKKLYCSLLFFDGSTGEVSSMLQTDILTNRESTVEGKVNQVTSIKVFEGQKIPLEVRPEVLAQGVERVYDYVKLVVSESEFDTDSLEQAGIDLSVFETSLSEQNLNKILGNENFRSLAFMEKKPGVSDWLCINFAIELVVVY